MEFYYKIRTGIYAFGIIAISLCYFLVSSKDNFSLEHKNIEADKALLNWKLNSEGSNIPDFIKNILRSPEKVEYLLKESHKSFDQKMSPEERKRNIGNVVNNFGANFKLGEISGQNKEELTKLIEKLIMPELNIFLFPDSDKDQEAYDKFLNLLAKYKTPVGTTLRQWGLRFLTSESIIIAVPLIQKGLDIDQISSLVIEQFINNLSALENKYSFKAPENVSRVLQNKITKFLTEKFAA